MEAMDSDGQPCFFSQLLLWWWTTKGEKNRLKLEEWRGSIFFRVWAFYFCQTGLTGLYFCIFENYNNFVLYLVCGLEYICVVCIMCVIDLFMLSKWYCASVTQIVWCIVFLAGCLGQTGLTGLCDWSDQLALDRAMVSSLSWGDLFCHMHHV